MEATDGLNRQRDRERQFAENSGRQATAYVTYTTEGAGDIVLDGALGFSTEFVEEPALATGVVLNKPPSEKFLMPRTTAGVYRWERNERGFYIGAFMFITVDIPPRPGHEGDPSLPKAKARLIHHFFFTALSYKQVGGDAMAELEGEVNPNLLPRVS